MLRSTLSINILSCLSFFQKLVTTNEGLESKIRNLSEAKGDEITKELQEEVNNLQVAQEELKEQKKALQKENEALRVE